MIRRISLFEILVLFMIKKAALLSGKTSGLRSRFFTLFYLSDSHFVQVFFYLCC